ncbi:hypothetical protein V6N11_082404 [Hibiscus sabdariffa]|uniref:Uncharacterized protein n=2 Tax=Hibiscus sabdariffa TaxID=183260 RepID=A0ABR2PCE4_9ROSI
MEKEILGYDTLDLSRPNLAIELKLFLQHHQLPLGKDSRIEIEMVAFVGHSCDKSADLLSHFMTYKKLFNDKIATWSGLGCKNFTCLNSKKLSRDYVGCLDLVNGYETQRYVKARSKIVFLMDDVLAMGNGGIRIRLEWLRRMSLSSLKP